MRSGGCSEQNDGGSLGYSSLQAERVSGIVATYGAFEVLEAKQQRTPLRTKRVAVGDEGPKKDDRQQDGNPNNKADALPVPVAAGRPPDSE